MAAIFEVTSFDPALYDAVAGLVPQLAPHAGALTRADFEGIVRDPQTHLFVLGDDGGQIAGMTTVALYKTPTGQKAWIEDVVTDPRFRGRGYGRMLVAHALGFVKSQGVRTVMLTTSPARAAANELYRSLGFSRRETNVYQFDTGE